MSIYRIAALTVLAAGAGFVFFPAAAQETDNPLGMTLTHTLPNGYTAGQDVLVTLTIDVAVQEELFALGLAEELPSGWTFKNMGNVSTPQPAIFPGPGEQVHLEFAWITAPSVFPYSLSFVLTPPAEQTEPQHMSGQAEYRLQGGGALHSNVSVLDLDPGFDYEPPVITLLGGSIVVVEQNQPYVEPGYTAMDDVDGNITELVAIDGIVDTAILGDYVLIYSVSDAAGNQAAPVSRTVQVVEPGTTLKGFLCCSGVAADGGGGFYADMTTLALVVVALMLFRSLRARREGVL